jgi:hypothetical protein
MLVGIVSILVGGCIIYWINLKIIALPGITSSNDTVVLSSQTVFGCINHKVASTLAKVLRTCFSTTTFEESDGGIVRCIMSNSLVLDNLSRVDMVLRGYCSCILATCLWILFQITLEINRITIFNLSNTLNMFESHFIMLMRLHG